MFVIAIHVHPSLIFPGEARSLPLKRSLEGWSTRVGSILTNVSRFKKIFFQRLIAAVKSFIEPAPGETHIFKFCFASKEIIFNFFFQFCEKKLNLKCFFQSDKLNEPSQENCPCPLSSLVLFCITAIL